MAQPGTIETIEGGCHCGAIRYEFALTRPSEPILVRACGCNLCQKHRAVWTSDPDGAFRLILRDPLAANPYRFGTRTAEFHICRTCGVMPISTCLVGPRRYAVLNIHTFEGVDHGRMIERRTDFEGETSEARLERRRRTWTPEAAV